MIVDASVAIKWLVREEDSELADALIMRGGLIAPDLIASEIANAIWKKRSRNELTDIPASLGNVIEIFDSLEPTAPLIVRATEIAVELSHPAYDCFYLALAEVEDSQAVTADKKLLNKLAGTSYAHLLLSLQDAVA